MPKMMEVLTRVEKLLRGADFDGLADEVQELVTVCREATGDVTVRVTEEELDQLMRMRVPANDVAALSYKVPELERALLELSLWRKLK